MCQNRSFSYRRFSQKFYQKTTFLIFWKKRMILSEKKNKVLKRAQKWTFSKGVSPWILSKNRTFSYCCFLQKLCQKRSFFDIYERKERFWVKKLKYYKGSKNGHFLKGLKHGVLSKNRTFFMGVFHRNYVRKDRFWIS